MRNIIRNTMVILGVAVLATGCENYFDMFMDNPRDKEPLFEEYWEENPYAGMRDAVQITVPAERAAVVPLGETLRIKAVGGNLGSKGYTWTVDKPALGSVEQNGQREATYKAGLPGQVIVTCEDENDWKDVCVIDNE